MIPAQNDQQIAIAAITAHRNALVDPAQHERQPGYSAQQQKTQASIDRDQIEYAADDPTRESRGAPINPVRVILGFAGSAFSPVGRDTR